MLKRFYPKQYENSVYEINYAELYAAGFKYIIFDIDNTLSPFDVKSPPLSIVNLMKRLKKIGFSICLFSNNNEERVVRYNDVLQLKAVSKAGKPKKKGVSKALSLINAVPEKTVLIGDQMFTDVWCGNRIGIHTILVKPVSNRDEWTVRIKRLPEKFVFSRYELWRMNNGD